MPQGGTLTCKKHVMKTETSKQYTATIKGIQSQGFNVIATVEKILVICPKTKRQVFEGNIEAAEEWLLEGDFGFPEPIKIPAQYQPIERPPFRRNACILFALCVLIYLGAAIAEQPLASLLGFFGLIPFSLGVNYALKHFAWEKKISLL